MPGLLQLHIKLYFNKNICKTHFQPFSDLIHLICSKFDLKKNHFRSMLALPQPSTRSLQHIYQVQLGRFLENGDFLPDVKELLNPLVSASIAIYYKMCANILPTPAKSHYTFNLRDLSKVKLGV